MIAAPAFVLLFVLSLGFFPGEELIVRAREFRCGPGNGHARPAFRPRSSRSLQARRPEAGLALAVRPPPAPVIRRTIRVSMDRSGGKVYGRGDVLPVRGSRTGSCQRLTELRPTATAFKRASRRSSPGVRINQVLEKKMNGSKNHFRVTIATIAFGLAALIALPESIRMPRQR